MPAQAWYLCWKCVQHGVSPVWKRTLSVQTGSGDLVPATRRFRVMFDLGSVARIAPVGVQSVSIWSMKWERKAIVRLAFLCAYDLASW